METAQWEASHAIWKVLPLHPRPAPLESMTSYLIRLAEENGLRSMSEFVARLGISYGRLTSVCTSPDYPAPFATPGLAQITGCPEERLQLTTFSPLLQRFGGSVGPHSLQRFLAGSIAPCLRYCPCCLAEGSPAYYSLLWRFLALPGCLEHGLQLLDQCGHCQSPLPLLSFPPKLAWCSTCQGDLRRVPARWLSEEARAMTHRRTEALQMLLSPLPGLAEQAQAKVIGKQYMARRLKLDLLISEASKLTGIAQSIIRAIEQISELRVATASLQDYLRYADTLSCSLLEVTDFDPTLPLLIPLSQVFNQVEVAIQHLEKQGQPLTRRNIRNLVGMEVVSLWDHPQMIRLLAKRPKGRIQQSQAEKIEREEEVIKLVEQAIEQIKARGVRVSQQRIADLVGMTRSALMVYPRVKARLEQLAERLSPLDLQRVVQDDVEQAQALGTSLAYWSVGERIGIPKETLRSDSQIRAIIDRAQNEARQRRENELVNRVEHAIEELVSQGKKVTVHKVSRLVGVDHKALDRRPHIKELFLVLR
jgi:hypothetical protein